MKSVTEFANITLKQGLAKKAALAAEGKTPEEIQAGLGESFKYEGDKLKYFTNALELAAQHNEGLKRVLVLSLGEGETAPTGATKVEDLHYVAEMQVKQSFVVSKPEEKGRGGKGKGGGRRN